jgi:hypothetical protein
MTRAVGPLDADTGEQWIDTVALGWTGDLVYIDMWGTGYGQTAC